MSDKEAVVTTKSGKLEGIYRDGLFVFKGIPYAEPPVGKLRWHPPQPVKPWDGVRQAKEFGPIAPQNPMQVGTMVQVPQKQDEDCLFLNIWTPGLDGAPRPVMVWIHGGAFTLGSGSEVSYDSGIISQRGDVVLVTLNYRLGFLGFFRLKDVTGGRVPATGNEGLMDQVEALKWIKENIAAFGGDPENITVFGESAGGMSIACLMVMPMAKGTFEKGILESGVGSTALPLDEVNAVASRFLEVAGIDGDDTDALYAMKPQQFLDLENKLRADMVRSGEAARVTVTCPVIDGEIIPDVVNEMARKGVAKDIPAIFGTNLDEFKLFALMQPGFNEADEAEVMKRLGDFLTREQAQRLYETYRSARQKRGDAANPPDILAAINTDLMFRVPVLEMAQAQRDNGGRAYSYLFTWESPVMGGVLGACHALEIGFVFGQYDEMFCGSGPDADKLSVCMQDAWIAFARSGDPSNDNTGKWPLYGAKRETMILGKGCHVEEAPYEEERAVWGEIGSYKAVLP